MKRQEFTSKEMFEMAELIGAEIPMIEYDEVKVKKMNSLHHRLYCEGCRLEDLERKRQWKKAREQK